MAVYEHSRIIALLSELVGKVIGSSGAVAGSIEPNVQTITDNTTGTQRSATYVSATGSGTVPAGSTSISISNIGRSAGTVAGSTLPAGTTLDFNSNYPDTLGALAYNATGTSFLIAYTL